VHRKIRGIVRNPAVAEKLLPRDYPLGTKRICVDTGYYETFNRENVTLIDTRSTPIKEITATGLQTVETEYKLDSIVFATGFDAFTEQTSPANRGFLCLILAEWARTGRNALTLRLTGTKASHFCLTQVLRRER
jgi:cation diffusion facilitator CzcD-associated flavoprotein CzcO